MDSRSVTAARKLSIPYSCRFQEHREDVTRAFYNIASGDPSSLLVQFAILLSGLVYAKSNGSQPAQLAEVATHLADLTKEVRGAAG